MEAAFEALINGLVEQQYGLSATFLQPELVLDLRMQLLAHFEQGDMMPAGIGNQGAFGRNPNIRNDVILWLEKEHNAAEKAFLEQIETFIEYLNRTCFTGINAYEFHYALYQKGHFYKRHKDQFDSDHGRLFSLVCYLNPGWTADMGGALILYPAQETIPVLPEGGLAVFFRSDEVEHEVQPANAPRLSIAGWLKRV